MTAYFDAIRRYFDFSGRSSRSQFWLYVLIFIGILVVALIVDTTVLGIDPNDFLLLGGLVYFFHIIPSLSITVRRLHDIDRSGWWVLIGLVPLIGLIVLIVFACTSSTGPNRFGPPVGQQHGGKPAYGAAGGHQVQPAASHLDQLEKLAALRSSGAIDDGEFERMKADVLANPRA